MTRAPRQDVLCFTRDRYGVVRTHGWPTEIMISPELYAGVSSDPKVLRREGAGVLFTVANGWGRYTRRPDLDVGRALAFVLLECAMRNGDGPPMIPPPPPPPDIVEPAPEPGERYIELEDECSA